MDSQRFSDRQENQLRLFKVIDRPPVFKISYAQISVYLQCPFRYKRAYVDGELKKSERFSYDKKVGRVVHLVLAQFLKDPVESRTLRWLLELLRTKWEAEPTRNTDEEEYWYQKAVDILEGFWTAGDWRCSPVHIERSFRVHRGEIALVGRLDRVDEFEPGRYEVIDYKSVQRSGTPQEVLNDLQWVFYYYGMRDGLNLVPSKITYYFLMSQRKLTIEPRSNEAVEGLNRILDVYHDIKRMSEFRAVANKYCSDCGFSHECISLRR